MSDLMLEGRLALVTGAGRGIGRAISLALADEGATVIAASRTLGEVEETADSIRALGGKAFAIVMDVADYAGVQTAVERISDETGDIDILVNNAGIQGAIGPLDTNDPEIWQRTIQVNLVGAFNVCHAVLPAMKTNKRGKIINLSGGGATAPRPNFSAYGAAKAGVVRLTETLADELMAFNIQVNAIAPGAVNTQMLDEVLAAGADAGAELGAAERRKLEGGTSPSLAAELAVFLASAYSDSLTGKLISAPHDDWRAWNEQTMAVLSSSAWLTLRRLDPHTLRPFAAFDLTNTLAELVVS
jgi:3-oxoacyl-[acyl-carrier protein] reductase